MNSAEPRGKEETGEGRAVGAGRGRAPARPSRGRPGPPRGSAPRFGRSGRGRVTFRSGVRRLAGRFRRRRWEEPGLPEEAAPRPPPSAPAREPAPTPGPGLRPNRYLRVPPPDRDAEPFPPGRAVSSCLTSVRKRKDLRELQSLLQKSDESQMQRALPSL